MYQIQLEQFSGPLEKLLELIEEKKLDITRISLAQVTDEFIKYVGTLKSQVTEELDKDQNRESSRQLADFLVIASQLILIKSKALLPQLELTNEEEESVLDLERRLQIYAQVRPLVVMMKKHWLESKQTYSRGLFSAQEPFFYPPKNVTKENLHTSIGELLKTLGSYFYEHEKIKRQLFSLEEKISELSKKIVSGISKFSEIITKKTKEESIVLFLALLHLLRDRVLDVDQTGAFEEMQIKKL